MEFEISPEAAGVIRDRGGTLWIWPGADGWFYATTEPPGEQLPWKTFRPSGFEVNVDETIPTPQRWIIARPQGGGRHLDARWNGFGQADSVRRLPRLASSEPEQGSVARWRGHATTIYTLLVALVWILGLVGIHRSWFDAAPFAAIPVVLLGALLIVCSRRAWTWRQERRSDPRIF